MNVDTIVLDYGGVVADHYCEPFYGQLAAALGTRRAEARELLKDYSDQGKLYRLDMISKAEFWARVRQKCSADFDPDLASHLWAKSYILNQAMLSLMNYLKETVGLQVVVALNEDRARCEYILQTYDLGRFPIVASYQVGAMKPDGAFFEAVLRLSQRTGLADRVLFVDDRAEHVEAARSAGLYGHTFVNVGELCKFLDSMDLLPSS
jgi:FMN phosphatase YigB (HAD superfamily)